MQNIPLFKTVLFLDGPAHGQLFKIESHRTEILIAIPTHELIGIHILYQPTGETDAQGLDIWRPFGANANKPSGSRGPAFPG